jgi:hypothetical protein
MNRISIVHPEVTRTVSDVDLLVNCTLFQKLLRTDLSRRNTPYVIKASVPVHVFHDFVSVLENNPIKITPDNIHGLTALCNEFGFEKLLSQLVAYRSAAGDDCFAGLATRILVLEARSQQHEECLTTLESRGLSQARSLAICQAEFARERESQLGRLAVLEELVAAFEGELSSLVSRFEIISVAANEGSPDTQVPVRQMQGECTALEHEMRALRDSSLAQHGQLSTLESSMVELRAKMSKVETTLRELRSLGFSMGIPAPRPPPAPPPRRDGSVIVADLMTGLVRRCSGKSITLLWRGGRDVFKAVDFHRQCDSHPNTLTIIQDADGNVFGGFTPIAWRSKTSQPYEMADTSCRSFIFAFSRPDQFSIFRLRPNEQHRAIFTRATFGPRFGIADILISANCNFTGSHSTECGRVYAFDDSIAFLKVSQFIVTEIETFEIIN